MADSVCTNAWFGCFRVWQVPLVDGFGDLTRQLSEQAGNDRFPILERFAFGVLLFTNLANTTVVFPMLFIWIRRRYKNSYNLLWKAWQICFKRGRTLESFRDAAEITAIIPCYMPNEQDIILDTVNHILQHVKSPGELSVWVVYNTPHDLPEIEAALGTLALRSDLPSNRKLMVLRVHNSKSKADNLNEALHQITSPYVVIYDADHHPDSDSLLFLFEKLKRKKLDCVQGSTYIRNLSSGKFCGLLGRFVDAEFFVTHFLYFPAMKLLTRFGFFGGSNALWDREVLCGKKFSHDMQTEDIDVSLRALLEMRHIDFCPEARSGELAPSDFSSLYKQRLRWAVGWDQVSIKHFLSILNGLHIPWQRRLGLTQLLYLRWLMALASFLCGLIGPIIVVLQWYHPSEWDSGIKRLQDLLSITLMIISFCCISEAAFQSQHRGLQSWLQVIVVSAFLACTSIYVFLNMFLIVTSLWRILTGTVGGWVVTTRSSAELPTSSLERTRTISITDSWRPASAIVLPQRGVSLDDVELDENGEPSQRLLDGHDDNPADTPLPRSDSGIIFVKNRRAERNWSFADELSLATALHYAESPAGLPRAASA